MTTIPICVAACLALWASSGAEMADTVISSPNGKVQVAFALDGGAPTYSIDYEGRPVIKKSPLGFRFRGASPMVNGFALVYSSERSFDETWKPVWGTSETIRNHFNELTVALREESLPHRAMTIVFRVFDDGVGFRCAFPEQQAITSFEMSSEETRFRFAGNHTVWWTPADYDSYEHLYRETLLSAVRAANTPVTMRTADGLYLSVHEADLSDYAGMTLERADGDRFTLRCELVPWPDGVKVRGETPFETPWRTIQIGERPGDLVESRLVLNLNDPCVLDDTSWIRPMKYVGIWWGMHIGKYTWHAGPEHGATTENAKRHIDFAARHGIPALLIEGWNTGWEGWGSAGSFDFVTPYADFDLEEVVRYGRERGVSIIGHHETGGDVPSYEQQLEQSFSLYERLGVPAVKTGYAGGIFPRGQHHHGQWMVRHYRAVVRAAAEHHLMLDVHEPIKPTGISRTYPNMMTREGVRGMEYNAWSRGNPPEHSTILPFTRMLAGPLDYTPGILEVTNGHFDGRNRIHTTVAHQLALYAILWSPLQMAADLPENYEGDPAFGFIRDVPCDWDETTVLEAAIGDFVTIARRKGDDWFIGSVTDGDSRILRIPLTFLEGPTVHVAEIYQDGVDADFEENPTSMEMIRALVDETTWLTVPLARGGGQAVRLTPASERDLATLPDYAPPF